MDLFDGLHKGLGAPEARVEVPEDVFEDIRLTADEDLVSLWREDGWARYGHGLFWSVDPREYAALHEEWPVAPRDALVFGRSAFSDLFLIGNGSVFHLDAQYNRLNSLGPSAYVFLNASLKQSGFQNNVLDRELFETLRKKLGDLDRDECYGLFPALPLGGNDEDPDAYRRVKVREYLAILAQAHG